MSFTDAEKVKIREFLGSTALYVGNDSRLESAMVSVDSATEDRIRDTILTRLDAIDAQIQAHEDEMLASRVDEITVDAVRGVAALNAQGRKWAARLARALGFPGPRTDAFGASPSGWGPDYSGLS